MGDSQPDGISVRRMTFEFGDLDPVFIAGEPEESYQNVALSLLLPYLEPYLIRSMRLAKPKITDEKLARELDLFNAQEGQHYRQHILFNVAIRRHIEGLEPFEEELEADYQRFTKTKSLRFNLAYAEGFEALTCATARVFLEVDRSKWQPVALDLFQWHLVEEIEHRNVAFDVYDHVFGGYFYRLFVGLFAQWHLIRFVLRVSEHMLARDPRRDTEFEGKKGRRRRERRLAKIVLWKVLPLLWKTYLPWYTPHDVEMPPLAKELAAKYSAMAKSVA